MMRIIYNGKELTLSENVTLAQLISMKNINPQTIIVEYNGRLVKSESWPEVTLHENDQLEILRIVGGG